MGSPFSSSVCWICTCLEEFMIRGWGHIIPGWRWLYQLRPISNQPVGLGFPHRARRCQPGGPPFSSPVRRSCRCVEGFMIRGCGLILPGCGGSPRTPVNQRSASVVGVSTPCGAVSTRGIAVFIAGWLGVVEIRNIPCLLYTSPSPRDGLLSRMPSSA